MKEFIVYSKDSCTYCDQAKALLEKEGREYTEQKLDVDIDRDTLLEAIQYFGHGRTMPMIIRTDADGNQYRIGGFDELVDFINAETK